MNQRQTIRALIKVVVELRKLDPEMQMQTLEVLLRASLTEGKTMKAIADEVGISQPAISRNAAALGKWSRHQRPGLNLVVAEEDPKERRRKLFRVTPKGKELLHTLSSILNQDDGFKVELEELRDKVGIIKRVLEA